MVLGLGLGILFSFGFGGEGATHPLQSAQAPSTATVRLVNGVFIIQSRTLVGVATCVK